MSRADVLHFEPGAYLPKTRRLTIAQRGAYSDLLFTMWEYSDEQCVFPYDYAALGGMWGVCPEEAMQLIDAIMTPGMALLKIVKRHGIPHLLSTRLREQKRAADSFREAQSEKGKRSGAVRRANAANRGSTTVEPDVNPRGLNPRVLVDPCPRRPVSETPVSSMSSRVQGSGRGSYPQADPEPVIAYFAGKVHPRPLTADETRSVKRWVRVYGPDEARVQIGYAFQDGYGTNLKRIGGALKAAAARTEGRS